jgi:hypothetical protein
LTVQHEQAIRAVYGDPVSFLCGAVTAAVVLATTFVVLAMLSEG